MVSEKKVERVLLLDISPWFLPEVEGIELQVSKEMDLIPSHAYEGPHAHSGTHAYYKFRELYGASDETAVQFAQDMIRLLTERDTFDYVIIGNNINAGMTKAPAVAEDMRADRACIVWNFYTPGDERPYEELGYKNFMLRTEFREFFRDYLVAKHLEGE